MRNIEDDAVLRASTSAGTRCTSPRRASKPCRPTTRRCSSCPTSRTRSTRSTATRRSPPPRSWSGGARSKGEYAAKSETLHIIHKLLQAHALYEKDVEYVVQDGKVLIVDEFTGRLMPGRRWSDGLHQAVEAKEGVTVEEETPDARDHHDPELLPHVREARRHDRHRRDRGDGVLPDLQARRGRHPDQPAGAPDRQARPHLQDPAREVQRASSRKSSASTSAGCRCWSAR